MRIGPLLRLCSGVTKNLISGEPRKRNTRKDYDSASRGLGGRGLGLYHIYQQVWTGTFFWCGAMALKGPVGRGMHTFTR